jgi:hypothetical protein
MRRLECPQQGDVRPVLADKARTIQNPRLGACFEHCVYRRLEQQRLHSTTRDLRRALCRGHQPRPRQSAEVGHTYDRAAVVDASLQDAQSSQRTAWRNYRRARPLPDTRVNGHRFLPKYGHRFSPVAAIFSPHWWPWVSPRPGGMSDRRGEAEPGGRGAAAMVAVSRFQVRGLTPLPAVACASR